MSLTKDEGYVDEQIENSVKFRIIIYYVIIEPVMSHNNNTM